MMFKRLYYGLKYRALLWGMRLGQTLNMPARWLSGMRRRTFCRFYTQNVWGATESVSGPGSTLEATTNIRAALPDLIKGLDIRSIMDAPCGDFYWFQHLISELNIDYLGADIVPELISRNNAAFASDRIAFKVHDIVTEKLPKADLWFCRDCLFHLPLNEVRLALVNFVNSGIPYLLVTNHPQTEVNQEIIHGDFRPLNLQAAPFFLPEPRLSVTENDPKRLGQVMALWEAKAVALALKL